MKFATKTSTDHAVMHFFIASFSLRHLKGSNRPISFPHLENSAHTKNSMRNSMEKCWKSVYITHLLS